jgi:uncharacterized protein YutE (UPF0331/DUF86 family)
MISNIDFEKVKQKLVFIEQNLVKLERLRGLSREEFMNDFRNVDSAKYLIQVCIEAMLDIANHISARNRWGNPQTNREYFKILADKNIIDPKNIDTYFAMAKFRNRIVHMYYDIDDEMIYRILAENTDDIRKFIDEIGRNL